MDRESELFWQAIDNNIMDTIQLIRARWSNFNSIPRVDNLVKTLYEAYGISGYAADDEDKGWIK